MPTVIDDSKLDPLPPGAVTINDSQLDPEPEQIGPVETFAQGATNVFGAGPALVAALQYVAHGRPYAETKEAYKQRVAQAAEQNPKAAIAGKISSIVPETILGGAVGRAVGGVAKVAGISERVLPWAANNPVMAHVLEGIAGGAGYGAASGAGEAISDDKNVLEGAGKGAAGGAVIGGALGTVFGGISKAASGAVEREEAQIAGKALTGEEAKIVRDDVVSMLRREPELRSVIAKPATEATAALTQRLESLAERRASLLDAIDGGAGISIGKFAKSLTAEIDALAKEPLQEGTQKTLKNLRDSILKAWSPEELRIGIEQATKKGGEMESADLAASLTKRLDKVFVPAKKFAELEKAAEDAFSGAEKVTVQKAIGNAVAKHVEESTAKGAVEKAAAEELSKINRDYSAISAITESIGKRRESEPVHGLGKLLEIFTHHGPVGAGLALATGHYVPAAVLAAPALAKKGTQVLAWLEREAASGNQRAINILKASEVAKSVGTAGAGVVGSAKAENLSEAMTP